MCMDIIFRHQKSSGQYEKQQHFIKSVLFY